MSTSDCVRQRATWNAAALTAPPLARAPRDEITACEQALTPILQFSVYPSTRKTTKADGLPIANAITDMGESLNWLWLGPLSSGLATTREVHGGPSPE